MGEGGEVRQVKIHGGYVFRRGFNCRKEDMETLYFDHVMPGFKPYEMGTTDIDRVISFLKRWKTRKTSLHESQVRIRANAHAIIRETEQA